MNYVARDNQLHFKEAVNVNSILFKKKNMDV